MTSRRCVPLYAWAGDPAPYERAVAVLQHGDVVVLTGPASGPPGFGDEASVLARYSDAFHAHGVVTLGYTTWSYGTRTRADVINDAHRWRTLVGVDGIWVDETPSAFTPELLADARGIHGWVRAQPPHQATGRRKGVTAWNPGTWADGLGPVMRSLPDSLWCTVECAEADYSPSARSPYWIQEVHLVHGCADPAATRRSIRARYGYATPDVLPNPWDAFAGY